VIREDFVEEESKAPDKAVVAAVKAAPGRSCGECSMCCKIFKVDEFAKPRGVWCQHCNPGKGCMIHEVRPQMCRDFFCAYITTPQLGEEWKPSHSKIVLEVNMGGKRITAHVDPGRPKAWRTEPYYSALKRWSRPDRPDRKQVLVAIGAHVYAILPDREIDLGIVSEDEIIVMGDRQTPAGSEITAFKLPKSDPRARKMMLKAEADQETAGKNMAAQRAASEPSAGKRES
jgi:hypothetical protein